MFEPPPFCLASSMSSMAAIARRAARFGLIGLRRLIRVGSSRWARRCLRRWWTPAFSCGTLAGSWRLGLLARSLLRACFEDTSSTTSCASSSIARAARRRLLESFLAECLVGDLDCAPPLAPLLRCRKTRFRAWPERSRTAWWSEPLAVWLVDFELCERSCRVH